LTSNTYIITIIVYTISNLSNTTLSI